MARLNWGSTADRFFETGVDRGVLYVGNDPGVAWGGLVSVTESPTGAEPKPAYLDGVKFRNLASAEEFEATIEAFSAPKEFRPCEGIIAIQNGLVATQQPRKPFNFSYRTRVGNAIEGSDLGYKIHLVYNALAGPAERTHTSMGSDVNVSPLSWNITTLPPRLSNLKPTAHFVVDSRYTPPSLMAYLEDVLYGTESLAPRLLSAVELIELFNSPGPIIWRNLNPNPSAELNLTGIDSGVSGSAITRDNTKSVNGSYSPKATAGGAGGCAVLWSIPTLPGMTYSFGVMVWVPSGVSDVVPTAYTIANGLPTETKDEWTRVVHTFTAVASTSKVGVSTGVTTAGQAIWADSCIVVEGEVVPDYFDGDTLDGDGAVYEWVAGAHASQSIMRSLL